MENKVVEWNTALEFYYLKWKSYRPCAPVLHSAHTADGYRGSFLEAGYSFCRNNLEQRPQITTSFHMLSHTSSCLTYVPTPAEQSCGSFVQRISSSFALSCLGGCLFLCQLGWTQTGLCCPGQDPWPGPLLCKHRLEVWPVLRHLLLWSGLCVHPGLLPWLQHHLSRYVYTSELQWGHTNHNSPEFNTAHKWKVKIHFTEWEKRNIVLNKWGTSSATCGYL